MRAIFVAIIVNMLIFSSSSYARDDVNDYSIKEALNSAAEGKLNDVKLFFGKQKHGKVIAKKGPVKVNKKTNAFNKSDAEACEWVFLSAVIALQKKALKKGGNAVINIKSNYKNNLTSSNKTFQCGAGAIMAGVALTGEIVTLK
jgi:uncharacterized protein YbjQ (UPF0145 family)